MYKALINRLRELHPADFNETWEFDSACLLAMDEAADAIEEYEYLCNRYEKDYKALCARLPKWIPVTERLPKKPRNYPHCTVRECNFLVVLESTAVISAGYDFGEERWYGDLKVTHWMPLPEPPKEEI